MGILSHMRQYSEAIERLRTGPLFCGYSAEEIAARLSLQTACPTHFAPGEVLLAPGLHDPALFFLLEGTARVLRRRADGKYVPLSLLKPGNVFGMATLFQASVPFPNEIRAASECTALFLPRERVEQMIAQDALFARNYIALLSERILFLSRRIDTFTAEDPSQRLLAMLEEFHLQQGGEEGTFILPCTFTQLASLLNISRASLYRAIERLEKNGRLLRENRRFRLCQPKQAS